MNRAPAKQLEGSFRMAVKDPLKIPYKYSISLLKHQMHLQSIIRVFETHWACMYFKQLLEISHGSSSIWEESVTQAIVIRHASLPTTPATSNPSQPERGERQPHQPAREETPASKTSQSQRRGPATPASQPAREEWPASQRNKREPTRPASQRGDTSQPHQPNRKDRALQWSLINSSLMNDILLLPPQPSISLSLSLSLSLTRNLRCPTDWYHHVAVPITVPLWEIQR